MPTILDISSNQGTIDWKKAAPGHFGAYVKATEGATYVDVGFEHNAGAARRSGLHVGFYHFARPDHNAPEVEARHFLANAGKPRKGDLRPVLDFETTGHVGSPDEVNWARAFNHAYAAAADGIWPIFYSYSAFIRQISPRKAIGGGLWLADYGADDGERHPVHVPAPWKRLRLHQFTDKGAVPGISGHVDLSFASSTAGLLVA